MGLMLYAEGQTSNSCNCNLKVGSRPLTPVTPYVQEVVASTRANLDQWQKAQEIGSLTSLGHWSVGDRAERWEKPVDGRLKINVDAAIFELESHFGFAGVARDNKWVMKFAFGMIIEDCERILGELSNVCLRFVRRSANANRVAHSLARASRSSVVRIAPPDLMYYSVLADV